MIKFGHNAITFDDEDLPRVIDMLGRALNTWEPPQHDIIATYKEARNALAVEERL